MPKRRTSLKKQRSLAYNCQKGLCFYCELPMHQQAPAAFAAKYKISIKSAKAFECTGEHLIAHSEGGSAKQKNIVAACKFCNEQRHRKKRALEPKAYRNYVQSRISEGRWNSGILDC